VFTENYHLILQTALNTLGDNPDNCVLQLVRQDPRNPASLQMVTLKCAQCGNINSANATGCSRCNAKVVSLSFLCDKFTLD
jgi:hypothetical protein